MSTFFSFKLCQPIEIVNAIIWIITCVIHIWFGLLRFGNVHKCFRLTHIRSHMGICWRINSKANICFETEPNRMQEKEKPFVLQVTTVNENIYNWYMIFAHFPMSNSRRFSYDITPMTFIVWNWTLKNWKMKREKEEEYDITRWRR